MLIVSMILACAEEGLGIDPNASERPAGAVTPCGAGTVPCGDLQREPITDLASSTGNATFPAQDLIDAEVGPWAGVYTEGDAIRVTLDFAGTGTWAWDDCHGEYALDVTWTVESDRVAATLSGVLAGSSASQSYGDAFLPYTEASGTASPSGYSEAELPRVALWLWAHRYQTTLHGKLSFVELDHVLSPDSDTTMPTLPDHSQQIGRFSIGLAQEEP